MIKVYATLIR